MEGGRFWVAELLDVSKLRKENRGEGPGGKKKGGEFGFEGLSKGPGGGEIGNRKIWVLNFFFGGRGVYHLVCLEQLNRGIIQTTQDPREVLYISDWWTYRFPCPNGRTGLGKALRVMHTCWLVRFGSGVSG